MLGAASSAYSAAVGGTVVNIDANKGITIKDLVLVNNTAALAYLQIFGKAAADVTLGTTTPTHVIPMLASGGLSLPDLNLKIGGPACSIACTTGRANAVAATTDVFATYE